MGISNRPKSFNMFLAVLVITLLVVSAAPHVGSENTSKVTNVGEEVDEVNPERSSSYSISGPNYIDVDLSFDIDSLTFFQLLGYQIPDLRGCEQSVEIGEPILPIRLVDIVLPVGAVIDDVEAISHNSIHLPNNYQIFPAQQNVPISIPQEPSMTEKDQVVYSSTSYYPSSLLSIYSEGYLRDWRIQGFGIYPLQYLPSTGDLLFHTDITLSVSYSGGIIDPLAQADSYDPFYQVVRSQVENPQDVAAFQIPDGHRPAMGIAPGSSQQQMGTRSSVAPTLAQENYTYVIITSSALWSSFLPLVNWKTDKGVRTIAVNTSWITTNYAGVDNQDEYRQFIIDAVNDWNTEYVLLGGDVSIIQKRGCRGVVGSTTDNNIPTDYYYCNLDGDWNGDSDGTWGEPSDSVDLYPDIWLGRAPVETTTETTTFVNKVLTYEQNPPTTYQENMLFVAEYLDASTDGGIAKNGIGTAYVPPRFDPITKLYESLGNATDATVKGAINSGQGYINFNGHGNTNIQSFGVGSLVNNEITALINGDKQGIVYSIGCYTNAFDSNDAFAEKWLQNSNGGSVAYCGNSRYGWYSPGNPGGGPSDNYDEQFYNSLFVDDLHHMGQTLADSKMYYAPWSGNYGSYRWIQFCMNLQGDPELEPYTMTPRVLDVTHPEEVSSGIQTIYVQVNDSATSLPVDDALVCIRNGDTYGIGRTDSQGLAGVQVAPLDWGTLDITVTAHNYLPYESIINVTGPDNYPPVIIVNQATYMWFSNDPGNIIDVDFSNAGNGSDLQHAKYSILPTGPWTEILPDFCPSYTEEWNASAIWSSLPEGASTIYINLSDALNFAPMETITVFKDTVPPLVTVNTATYGWYDTDPGDVIDVDYSNGGGGSPLDKAQFKIGAPGAWTDIFTEDAPSNTTDWSLPWGSLQEGENTIYIRTYDVAQNEDLTSDSIIFKKDTTNPGVIINTATYGWYTSDPGDVVNVDFTNGGTGAFLDYAQYSIGTPGSWVDIFNSPLSSYSTDWGIPWNDLAEGENTVHIRVLDEAAHEDVTSDTILIKKDTIDPLVIVNQGDYGWFTSDPGAVIDVDFDNGGTGSLLSVAQYKIGATGTWQVIFSTPMGQYTSEWALPWAALSEGENTVYIRTIDQAGRISQSGDSIIVKKDISPPLIIRNTDLYGWYDTDPGDVIDVDFSNGGAGSDLSMARFQAISLSEQYEGPWHIIFDTNRTSYLTDWSVVWNELNEGSNTIVVELSDAIFTVNSTITILKDSLPPQVLVNVSLYGWYNTPPGYVIDVDFDNGGNGTLLDYAEYKVGDTGLWNRIFETDRPYFTAQWEVPWSILDEGANNVSIRTVDLLNHEDGSEDYITILRDTHLPDITVNTELYGWYRSDPGEVIDVDFDADDDASSLTMATYKIDTDGEQVTIVDKVSAGGDFLTYTDEWSVPWEDLEEGTNTIYVQLWDEAGNEDGTNDYITIKRDTLPPYPPDLTSPLDGSQFYTDVPSLYWKQALDRGGTGIVANYTLELYAKGVSDPLITTTIEDTSFDVEDPLEPGDYSWRVRATDPVGNVGEWSLSWEFSILDNTPPVADAGTNLVTTTNHQIELSASDSFDPDGDALTYSWDFDASDGIEVQSIEKSPALIYSITGTFTVTLTVTDIHGASDADTTQVKVNEEFSEDDDGDGYTNEEELAMGTDPLNDQDKPDVEKKDTDNDGIPDSLDTDDDNDGISDIDEYLIEEEESSASYDPSTVIGGGSNDGGDSYTGPEYDFDDDDDSLFDTLGFNDSNMCMLWIALLIILIIGIIGTVVNKRRPTRLEGRDDYYPPEDDYRQRPRYDYPDYSRPSSLSRSYDQDYGDYDDDYSDLFSESPKAASAGAMASYGLRRDGPKLTTRPKTQTTRPSKGTRPSRSTAAKPARTRQKGAAPASKVDQPVDRVEWEDDVEWDEDGLDQADKDALDAIEAEEEAEDETFSGYFDELELQGFNF